jgi:hypothetical protein
MRRFRNERIIPLLVDGFGACELSALFALSPSLYEKRRVWRFEAVRGTWRARRGFVVCGTLVGPVRGVGRRGFPSQDGKIAFTRDNFRQGTSVIFTVAPEGGGRQKIGPEYGYSPSWSADGQKAVFVGTPGRTRWSSNSTST